MIYKTTDVLNPALSLLELYIPASRRPALSEQLQKLVSNTLGVKNDSPSR